MGLLRWVLNSSGRQVLWRLLASVAASAASAGLIAVVHRALTSTADDRWLGLFALAAVARLGTTYVGGRLASQHDQQLLHALRTEVASRVLRLPWGKQLELGHARLLTHLTEDINALRGSLPALSGVLSAAAVTVGGAAYMAYISPAAVGMLCALGLISFQLQKLTASRALPHYQAAREHEERLQTHILDLLAGSKEWALDPSKRTAFFERALCATSGSAADAANRGRLAYVAAQAGSHAPALLAVFALLAGIGTDGPATAGTTGIILAALYVAGPLGVLLRAGGPWSGATLALARLQETFGELAGAMASQAHPAKSTQLTTHDPDIQGHQPLHAVQFRQLRVERKDSRQAFTLGPVDGQLSAGEVLFITGDNGSGKSTLACTLAGLLSPSGGQLLWTDVHGQPTSPQGQVAAVFSDYHLASQPWGLTAQASERLAGLLQQLDIADRLPASISEDTKLPRDALSQGQRRRLALGLALAEARPLLIFDEFAADQDAEHKAWFYDRLLPQLKSMNKLVVVVTHDDRYFGLADHRVHLRNERCALPVDSARRSGRSGLPDKQP